LKNKIPAKSTVRLLDSVAFLNSYHGVALNGMITVNFEQLGLTTEAEATRALTKHNEALADKIARYSRKWNYELPHFFVYAQEDVASSHGHHAHELLVVPRGLGATIDAWLKQWAQRNYPGSHPNAVQYDGRYPTDTDKRATQQRRLVQYILKSTEDACIMGLDGQATTLHAILEVEKRERAYCAPVRRVTGSSQNIAYRAQIKGGFWAPQHLDTVLTDQYLLSWQRGKQGDELWRVLRTIDI
jgi:hypothetical protein